MYQLMNIKLSLIAINLIYKHKLSIIRSFTFAIVFFVTILFYVRFFFFLCIAGEADFLDPI
ncbi:hypothetical protein VAE115_370507 [Vibrio aestuarianus]|nr:hypothetical protein VIBAE_B10594 [Vibrio aestuarianus subsp. francensis]CAH8226394.1 hypothetical protein VAE115_370507 [Vibrio aestuarianus]